MSWSWSPGKFVQAPGTWIVDGQEAFCGNATEFTTVVCSTWFGVGCGNGGGATTKLFPGVNSGGTCVDRSTAHSNGAFLVCGTANYGSWSVFVRAGD